MLTSSIRVQEPVCSVQQAPSQSLICQKLRSRSVLHNLQKVVGLWLTGHWSQ